MVGPILDVCMELLIPDSVGGNIFGCTIASLEASQSAFVPLHCLGSMVLEFRDSICDTLGSSLTKHHPLAWSEGGRAFAIQKAA